MVMDLGQHRLDLLRTPGEGMRSAKDTTDSAIGAEASNVQNFELSVGGEPVAVLEMPRKVNGSRDLVVLRDNSSAPDTVTIEAATSITVDTTADNGALSACTGAPGDCSL